MVYVMVYLLMVVITAVLFCYEADVYGDVREVVLAFLALALIWPITLTGLGLMMLVSYLLALVRRVRS